MHTYTYTENTKWFITRLKYFFLVNFFLFLCVYVCVCVCVI